VFDFIRCSADPGKLEQLVASDAAYQDMDEDAYDMAAQYSSAAQDMIQVKDYYKHGGQVNMADAITELRRMSKEEGIEQGLAQGLARGRAESARETARTMLEKGYSDEEIIDILKMDKEELDRLRKEMMQMV
jgi:flagellar biosynthesis/type III secretory pathway protein FliH